MASTSQSNCASPFLAAVQAPVFSPSVVNNPPVNSVDERALSTCFDTLNWKDKAGYGCDWLREYDRPGCPEYGSSFEGDMGVANDNCCYCGGGSHTLSPTTSPKPSSSPTKSASPTELCFDTPNWKDAGGDGCDYYERYHLPGCPNGGSWYDGGMGVAKDNCCYCGGGSHTLSPTISPTITNSPTKSATPSSAPSSAPSICTDTPGWYDFNGYDCSWYEAMDDPGCPQYGDLRSEVTWLPCVTSTGVANDNCCYCQNAVVSTLVSES
jgi:hypothetical protein